jgi:hypothetical protein
MRSDPSDYVVAAGYRDLIGLVQQKDAEPMLSLCREIGRMLNALRTKLNGPKLATADGR